MSNLRNNSLKLDSVGRLGRNTEKEREARVVLNVDPASCKLWDHHNRNYDGLTEESCRDLLDSFLSQGQQEFPAIVRKITGETHDYEVICGARRHWSANWMRENGHPGFKYLIEIRELTDLEAFKLADVENRNRSDISHFERATDYLKALSTLYDSSQKKMAQHLNVSDAWLSRYLDLARLPAEIVSCFPQKSSILPGHAKRINQRLKRPSGREELMQIAKKICSEGEQLSAKKVMKNLVGNASRTAEKTYFNKKEEKIFSTEIIGGHLKLLIDLNKKRASNADLKRAFSKVIEDINGEVIVR